MIQLLEKVLTKLNNITKKFYLNFKNLGELLFSNGDRFEGF